MGRRSVLRFGQWSTAEKASRALYGPENGSGALSMLDGEALAHPPRLIPRPYQFPRAVAAGSLCRPWHVHELW